MKIWVKRKKSKDSRYIVGHKYYSDSGHTFDLTAIFGEGKEPTIPEDFEKMFPKNYIGYKEDK